MYNKVVLVGRLTADPQVRYSSEGKPICHFSLAVDRIGSNETDFFDIVAFGNLADIASRYLYKGRLVLIEGRLQTRTYETPEGIRRKVWEIVARDMRMLDRKRQEREPETRYRTSEQRIEEEPISDFDEFSELPF